MRDPLASDFALFADSTGEFPEIATRWRMTQSDAYCSPRSNSLIRRKYREIARLLAQIGQSAFQYNLLISSTCRSNSLSRQTGNLPWRIKNQKLDNSEPKTTELRKLERTQ